MHVLVVEDDQDARQGMVNVLTRAGLTVTETGDGLSGLEQARQGRFHAIILDLRLPGLPGGGVYEELAQGNPELARRVIFVSGITYDPTVREFLNSTGQPYLGKPYDAVELVETVMRVMKDRETAGR